MLPVSRVQGKPTRAATGSSADQKPSIRRVRNTGAHLLGDSLSSQAAMTSSLPRRDIVHILQLKLNSFRLHLWREIANVAEASRKCRRSRRSTELRPHPPG